MLPVEHTLYAHLCFLTEWKLLLTEWKPLRRRQTARSGHAAGAVVDRADRRSGVGYDLGRL